MYSCHIVLERGKENNRHLECPDFIPSKETRRVSSGLVHTFFLCCCFFNDVFPVCAIPCLCVFAAVCMYVYLISFIDLSLSICPFPFSLLKGSLTRQMMMMMIILMIRPHRQASRIKQGSNPRAHTYAHGCGGCGGLWALDTDLAKTLPSTRGPPSSRAFLETILFAILRFCVCYTRRQPCTFLCCCRVCACMAFVSHINASLGPAWPTIITRISYDKN